MYLLGRTVFQLVGMLVGFACFLAVFFLADGVWQQQVWATLAVAGFVFAIFWRVDWVD